MRDVRVGDPLALVSADGGRLIAATVAEVTVCDVAVVTEIDGQKLRITYDRSDGRMLSARLLVPPRFFPAEHRHQHATNDENATAAREYGATKEAAA